MYLDAVGGEVQGDEGDQALAEQLADDLADAPEAGDDHVVAQLARLALAGLQRLRGGWQPGR